MNQTETLKTKGNLLRGAILPKKKHGLRRASPKRQEQNKQYLKLRREFLRNNRFCDVGIECNYGHGGVILTAPSTEIHHKFGRRGVMLTYKPGFVAICRKCHDYLHRHPREARAMGWIQ